MSGAERPLGAAYEASRRRIAALVRAADDDSVGTRTAVPACPGWTVHDVVAHLTGGCADVVAGNIEGAATSEWTAAQLEARRGTPIDEVLAEWEELAPTYASWIDDFPGRLRHQAVGDITVHEHDIRGALGRPGHRDEFAVDVATDFVISAIADPGARAAGLGPIEVRAGDHTWVVGSSDEPMRDPAAAVFDALLAEARPADGRAPVGSVGAGPFELFRAFTGRRSAAQICSYQWSVDPAPFVPVFAMWPFTLRQSDLVD